MKEKAYAKINLTLNILNKRNDGYHNLKSVMIPIDLYDELSFEISDEYQLISNYDLNVDDNIITKVFNIFKEKYKIGNVKITLNKKIPTQAGLGGGSADATATIRGLNDLFELDLSIKELETIANCVGSDTLFTLHNKPAVVTSRGDELSFIDINSDFYILLIKPNLGISTKEAFENIKEYNLVHNDGIINALKENDLEKINEYCYNSFLDSVLINKEFKDFYDLISSENRVHLSGSGSTFFIIDELEKLENIERKLKSFYTNIVKTLKND